MVTYCIGSARQKRAYFKNSDVVLLDNIEVLFCASENGKNYFAYGDLPFSEFTAASYLCYRRALCGGASAVLRLDGLGIKPTKRIGKLCPAEMRCVMFAEKTGGMTDKTVVINLDGTKCTRKNVRALKILLSRCTDAYVCVTDKRFVKRMRAKNILAFGDGAVGGQPKFYNAKILAARLDAKRVAVM